jgi:hypothetical protein
VSAIKGLAASLATLGVAFLAVTWWALEAEGVAILRTSSLDGAPRSTHVWYVRDDGDVLLEAGAPENGWFADVERTPELRIVEPDPLAGRYSAKILANPDGHERIRALLRGKYGWRDRWIGILFDTSRSVAVRLTPAEASR